MFLGENASFINTCHIDQWRRDGCTSRASKPDLSPSCTLYHIQSYCSSKNTTRHQRWGWGHRRCGENVMNFWKVWLFPLPAGSIQSTFIWILSRARSARTQRGYCFQVHCHYWAMHRGQFWSEDVPLENFRKMMWLGCISFSDTLELSIRFR